MPNVGIKWFPSVLAVFYELFEKVKDKKRNEACAQSDCPLDNPVDAKRLLVDKLDIDEKRCHFGHRTTSARRDGIQRWHRNPNPSLWLGAVPSGVTLCSRCYQNARRAKRQSKTLDIPQYEHSELSLVPTPGTSAAECSKRLKQAHASDTPSRQEQAQNCEQMISTNFPDRKDCSEFDELCQFKFVSRPPSRGGP